MSEKDHQFVYSLSGLGIAECRVCRLKLFEATSHCLEREPTTEELEKLRQGLWDYYNGRWQRYDGSHA